MPFLIEQYRAGWKPNSNEGRIQLRSPTGQSIQIDLGDPAEFTAILTILATSNAAAVSDDGVVMSAAEELDG